MTANGRRESSRSWLTTQWKCWTTTTRRMLQMRRWGRNGVGVDGWVDAGVDGVWMVGAVKGCRHVSY